MLLRSDIDDLCALAMVLNWPNAELLAVTTAAEHGGKRAGYARYDLGLAGREDIPVAAGAGGFVFQFLYQRQTPRENNVA